ncbi:hypothetical protein CGCVW01_v007326 [Colletotrichum viniferum]|nr:hypothetical protein CGCVW01_v007326 [Colletotrichum viniferum]
MSNRVLQDPGLPARQPTASYWQQPLHSGLSGIQSTSLPTNRDVVIIGSGITACSVARELLQSPRDLTLTVLEAREVCSGATGRNGGRINCVAVLDYDKYYQKFGKEAATKIVRFELAHFDRILAAAKELGLEDFEKSEVREVGTCAAVFEDEQLADLRQKLANFEAAFPDLQGRWRIADQKEAVETFKIPEAKGALVGQAGAAWPYRLITSIWASLLTSHSSSLTIESNTPAMNIRRAEVNADYPYAISTPRGIVRARHIFHCTEGHASHLIPGLRGIIVPRRGEMTVQTPGSQFHQRDGAYSWSFYFPHGFDYLTQNARSGELFVGGGDVGGEEALMQPIGIGSDAEEIITAKAHLAGVLGVVFGQENTGDPPKMRASWTGIMANTLDGVPLVGMLPQAALDRTAGDRNSAEWICAGYGGYGMVNAWLSGRAVVKMFSGEDVRDWFPGEYVMSSERMGRLQEKLEKVKGSQMHLKALL